MGSLRATSRNHARSRRGLEGYEACASQSISRTAIQPNQPTIENTNRALWITIQCHPWLGVSRGLTQGRRTAEDPLKRTPAHLHWCILRISQPHLRPYSHDSTRTKSVLLPRAFSYTLAPQSLWCSPVTTGASAWTRSDSRRFKY
jgi:hypothetical protein